MSENIPNQRDNDNPRNNAGQVQSMELSTIEVLNAESAIPVLLINSYIQRENPSENNQVVEDNDNISQNTEALGIVRANEDEDDDSTEDIRMNNDFFIPDDTNVRDSGNVLELRRGDYEPPNKRPLLDVANPTSCENENVKKLEKLEHRLGGIFCCAVCLDLPKTAIYQCQMGHLMCSSCFNHILADGRLLQREASCPNCRTQLSRTTISRNLAVEKAASELPSECQYCKAELPYRLLKHHEKAECEMRKSYCKYSILGCKWMGEFAKVAEHEMVCNYPKKSGAEIMSSIVDFHESVKNDNFQFKLLVKLLHSERIAINDIQFRPYVSNDSIERLVYQSVRFHAFNHLWTLRGQINDNQRNPHQSMERFISYQLILKSKMPTQMNVYYYLSKTPNSELKMDLKIYHHIFTEHNLASNFQKMPLQDTNECNRLLSAKCVALRFIMFLVTNPNSI